MGIKLEFYNELEKQFKTENIVIVTEEIDDSFSFVGFKLFKIGDKLIVYNKNDVYYGKFC